MIYSLLPSVVQSRLPRLATIQKLACTYGTEFENERQKIEGQDRIIQQRLPSEYDSEIAIRPTQVGCKEAELDTREIEPYFDESSSGLEGVKQAQIKSSQHMLGTQSGIDWKFANQGIHLLGISGQESATLAQNQTYGNARFERQLYLDGLSYLLRALPPDLTSAEKHSVRSTLAYNLDLVMEDQPSVSSSEQEQHAKAPSPPSILHKIMASTIVQLFIIFHFLLPYVKVFLRSAYEYEREHNISQKVLASGIDLADMLGKQSLTITAALYGMGNGKVGETLIEICRWVAEGVTGGIHDGIGEGLSIVGASKPSTGESG